MDNFLYLYERNEISCDCCSRSLSSDFFILKSRPRWNQECVTLTDRVLLKGSEFKCVRIENLLSHKGSLTDPPGRDSKTEYSNLRLRNVVLRSYFVLYYHPRSYLFRPTIPSRVQNCIITRLPV